MAESTEANKTVIRKWAASVFNGSTPGLERDHMIDQIISANHVATPARVKASWNEFHEVFKDVSATIEDIIAEGDRVTTRLSVSALHKNKPTNWSAIYIHKLAGGKIVDVWSLQDHPR